MTDEITTDEVESIISQLKNTKAPGPDEIRPILLKNLPETGFQALTNIYNNCMNTCMENREHHNDSQTW
jgi:superfamily II DNA/RNA helicase